MFIEPYFKHQYPKNQRGNVCIRVLLCILCIYLLNFNLSILGHVYANADSVTNVGANVTVPNIIDVVNVTTTTTTTTTTVEGEKVMTGNMQLNFLYENNKIMTKDYYYYYCY